MRPHSSANEAALFGYLTQSELDGTGTARKRARMRASTVLLSMPWRKAAHARARDGIGLFIRPTGRAVGLGVAVVTVDSSDPDRPTAMTGIRSHEVGTYPDAMHVIPSGNCNTHGTNGDVAWRGSAVVPPWYLSAMMRCEFLEEWYNEEDLVASKTQHWQRDVDRRWIARGLAPLEPTLTGIAFDLLNLRPEICAVIQVDPENAYLNWEWTEARSPVPLREIGTLKPGGMVQSAAGALWLARRGLPSVDD